MPNRNGNGSTPTPPRKRKGKGIVIEEPQPRSQPRSQPPPQLPPPPPAAAAAANPFINNTNTPQQSQNIFSYYPPLPNVGPSSTSTSHVQRILNSAAPVRPFSFTSLLTAPYSQIEGQYHNFVSQAEINQIIGHHSENLKQSLTGILEKQEERAAKKLKEKEVELQVKCSQNAELESMVELYKRDAADAQYRIMSLQNTVNSLRTELRDVMDSIVDSSEDESSEEANMVRLDCKVCETQMANVMMWPCRHICVCVGCDMNTNACPVCGSFKTSSVRVLIPN